MSPLSKPRSLFDPLGLRARRTKWRGKRRSREYIRDQVPRVFGPRVLPVGVIPIRRLETRRAPRRGGAKEELPPELAPPRLRGGGGFEESVALARDRWIPAPFRVSRRRRVVTLV